jgi:hypothetical protein
LLETRKAAVSGARAEAIALATQEAEGGEGFDQRERSAAGTLGGAGEIVDGLGPGI